MNDNKGVFADDEMQLRPVDPTWDRKTLLAQDGIFFLKDLVEPLGLEAHRIKRMVRDMEASGEDTYQILGMRRVWKHWVVRMTTFAPYYRKYLIPRIRKVHPHWDGNELLKQKGWFKISDVATLLPFNAHQLRYQAKKIPDSRREIGVWKDMKSGLYVVDMEIFAQWVRATWQGASKKPQKRCLAQR